MKDENHVWVSELSLLHEKRSETWTIKIRNDV